MTGFFSGQLSSLHYGVVGEVIFSYLFCLGVIFVGNAFSIDLLSSFIFPMLINYTIWLSKIMSKFEGGMCLTCLR